MRCVFIVLLIAACSGEQKPTAPAGKAIVAQSQSRLEPDPSEVEFYVEDPAWKTFTVRTDLDSVLVRANPSGSDPAIEIAGGQDAPTSTRDYCPAEGNDSPSRGRRDGWSLHVKACQIGRTEILLIDYDTREVLQRYEVDVKEYPTQTRLTSGREPRWSPDGQRIVFYSDRNGGWDIYSMEPDGSNQTQLTTHESGDWSPTWSPDGLRIAFVSQRDGYDSIHIMDSDGKNKHRLTSNSRHDEYPRWSPDGRRIAYVSVRRENNRENREIYVMDADGRNKKRLTRHVEDDWLPAWSPDGQSIAFLSLRNLDIEIHVMDADGGNKKRLTHRNPSYYPAWSPDGSRIAYNSLPSFDDYGKGRFAWGANHEIYVMDADGGNKKRLTWAEGSDFGPAWSPDGKRIAFVSERDGGYEIYVMDADGRNKKRLTYGDGNDAGMPTALAWLPNSQRIVFERDREEEIYIVEFVD